jgi:Ca2+-binding EF-hand superfamily protein
MQLEPVAVALKKKSRSLEATKTVEANRDLLDSLTVPQVAALHSTFLKYSEEQYAGFITAKHLGPLLRELGDEPTPDDLQELISKVDAEGNGLIDIEEFAALLAIRTRHRHPPKDVTTAMRVRKMLSSWVACS